MNPETTETLSPPVRDLILHLGQAAADVEETNPKTQTEPFFLSQISDRAGVLYEKIRGAVDNKEEHFLRRHAIRRLVKRIGWVSVNPKTTTQILLSELYRGGYLPRRRISEKTTSDVEHTVKVFLELSRAVSGTVAVPEFLRLRIALLDIVAGAIEDRLYSTYNEESVVVTLARVVLAALDDSGMGEAKDKKQLLVYVAAWRSMFGADNSLLMYKLWLLEHPSWEDGDANAIRDLGKQFPSFVRRTGFLLGNKFIGRLIPRMRNLAIAMTVIYGLIKRYRFGAGKIMENAVEFDAHAREIIGALYRQDIERSGRRSWRALIYIFLTKGLLAILVEAFYFWTMKDIELDPLVVSINLLFHPALLFLLTRGLFAPEKKNTERLVALIHSIVRGKELPTISVRSPEWGILHDIALALYIIILSGMLALITTTLDAIGFRAVDTVFFVFFLVLVIYFGFRIRYAARRMELLGGHEGFFRSLMELLALPMVSLGRWLVQKFERLNFIAIFLDFFIELPLKLLFEFFDSFSRLLREKKEELYS